MSDAEKIKIKLQEEKHLAPRTRGEIIKDLIDDRYVVKKDGEKIVGFARINKIADEWEEIGSVFVDNDYRSRGLGTSLVKETMQKTSQQYLIGVARGPMSEVIFQRLGFFEIEIRELPINVITGMIKDRVSSGKRLVHLLGTYSKDKSVWVTNYGNR